MLNAPYDSRDKRTVIPEYLSYSSKHSAGGLVLERKTTRWTPTGSNSYVMDLNSSVQPITFRVASDHLLDLESATLQFSVQSTAGATAISSVSLDNGGMVFFKTAVVRVAGQVIETIENVGTVHNLVSYMSMPRDYMEGSGFVCENQWRLCGSSATAGNAPGAAAVDAQGAILDAAPGASSTNKIWFSVPLSILGITRTNSYFPARFASPIEFEFTTDTLANCLFSQTVGTQMTGSRITLGDMFLSCDQVVCASQYYAALGQKIQGGDGLVMMVPTIATQQANIQAATGTQTVTISRGLSNLLSVWAVVQPTADQNQINKFSKSDFWLAGLQDVQLLVAGGKQIPDQPATGPAEIHQEAKKSFGNFGSIVGASAFGPYNYIQTAPYAVAGTDTVAQTARCGVIGLNCEGVVQQKIDVDNGISTAATGSNIQLRLTYATAPAASTVLACLHYGVRIKLQGGQLYKLE